MFIVIICFVVAVVSAVLLVKAVRKGDDSDDELRLYIHGFSILASLSLAGIILIKKYADLPPYKNFTELYALIKTNFFYEMLSGCYSSFVISTLIVLVYSGIMIYCKIQDRK